MYFLPWESRGRLPRLLERAGLGGAVGAGDLVAVKMHFGEEGNDGHIAPGLVRPVIEEIKRLKGKPFLTDTNTIYRGQRTNAVDHMAVAAEHGFSEARAGAPVIIADGLKGDDCGEVEIRAKHFERVEIAAAILKARAIISLAHFKGHMLAGFGGAIKNLGMGCASRAGKFKMHSGVSPEISVELCMGCAECVASCAHGAMKIVGGKIRISVELCKGCGECVVACDYKALNIAWDKGAGDVQERCAEYALGAVAGKPLLCVNFLNHITPNCDCMSEGEEPLLCDIGVLASRDPVASDQASLDLVIRKAGDVFRKVRPDVDGTVQLVHGEGIGLGKRAYRLIEI